MSRSYERPLALQPELLEPQQEMVDALQAAREQGLSSGYVDVATGVGKTYAIAHDIKSVLEDNPEARVLYLCHKGQVLEQARETMEATLSDVTHGNVYGGEFEDREQIVYATFQTLNSRQDDGKVVDVFDATEFDYVVVDESHHAPAPTYENVIDHFDPKFLVGLTATPERTDQKEISKIFGAPLYRYSLETAIAHGVLTRPDYRLFTEHERTIRDTIQDVGAVSLKSINDQLERVRKSPQHKDKIAAEIIKTMQEHDDPRAVIYCPSIAHAEDFAQRIPLSQTLHSKLDPKDQRDRLADFRAGETPALLVVDQFNEGIDVPEINTLVFLRGTESKTVFLQQLGRGLRKHDSKDKVIALDFASSWQRIKLIADLKKSVEHIHSKQKRARTLRKRRNTPAVNQEFEIPFEFNFSQDALDTISVISQTRSEKKPVVINPNKGKRLESWEVADEYLRKTLSLETLPNQRMSMAETAAFGKRIAKGDFEAREEYVMRRLRSVYKDALKIYEKRSETSPNTFDDYFQAMFESYLESMSKFSVSSGENFQTHMGWAKYKAEREMNDTSRMIRLPAHITEKKRHRNDFIATEDMLTNQVAQHSDRYVPIEDISEMLGSGTPDIMQHLSDTLAKQNLRRMLERISYRERRTLELRYGLGGEAPLSLDEAGHRFNVTRERIRQIENQALKKLAQMQPEDKPHEFTGVALDNQDSLGKSAPTEQNILLTRKRLLQLREDIAASRKAIGYNPEDSSIIHDDGKPKLRAKELLLYNFLIQWDHRKTEYQERKSTIQKRDEANQAEQNAYARRFKPHPERTKRKLSVAELREDHKIRTERPEIARALLIGRIARKKKANQELIRLKEERAAEEKAARIQAASDKLAHRAEEAAAREQALRDVREKVVKEQRIAALLRQQAEIAQQLKDLGIDEV